jgi:5-methylcytosine-specific restriction enzyme subunit McrC
MLRETWDMDAREAAPTTLRETRLPVFEAFIRMFLDCVSVLVKRGLPGGYARVEENIPVFKGKLLVREHLRSNIVRRDRFFVAHDVFSLDNPANRILRSGMEWTVSTTRLEANRRAARQFLAVFEDVPPSSNLAGDFASCTAAERDAHCKKAIDWCRVFLCGKSVSNLP